MAKALRARLAREVMRVSWSPLAPHAKRGGLILVDATLDLVDVARQLARPTEEQNEKWKTEAEDRFTAIIVQPYVLARRDTR